MLTQIAEDAERHLCDGGAGDRDPTYAQKRIVHEIRKLSSQSLFTRIHSTSLKN
jgi:hypothetical protein